MFGGVPLFRQWKKDFATLTRNAALNSRLKRGIAAFQLKKQHSAALHLEHPEFCFAETYHNKIRIGKNGRSFYCFMNIICEANSSCLRQSTSPSLQSSRIPSMDQRARDSPPRWNRLCRETCWFR